MTTRKTVLITGSTSGIGRHAALYLANKGYHVLATGRREDALAELTKDAKNVKDARLDTIRLDVTDYGSIDAAVIEANRLTNGHGVDVLINNAGYGCLGPTSEISDEDMRQQFETNVFGLMAVNRAFIPQMRERGAGKILNVSSVGGRMTLPFFGVYNATKYALESLSDAMRLELKPFGIDVVLIEPGLIATNFGDVSMGHVAKYTDSPFRGALERADEVQKTTDKMAVGPKTVSKAMHRAIKSRRPAARYIAPWRTKTFLWLLQILPTSWGDAMMRRMVHLNKRTLLPGASAPRAALSQRAS